MAESSGSEMDADADLDNTFTKKRKRDGESLRDLVKANNELLHKLLKQQTKTNEKLGALQEENIKQAQQIEILQEKVEFLSRGGQYNLILQGKEECDNENTKSIAQEILKTTMDLTIDLAFATRIGRGQNSKPRHILMKVRSTDEKIKIRNKGQALKKYNETNKTSLYINEDAPRSERIRQAQLRKLLKIARQTDPAAKLSGTYILSKGEKYKVEENGSLTKFTSKIKMKTGPALSPRTTW